MEQCVNYIIKWHSLAKLTPNDIWRHGGVYNFPILTLHCFSFFANFRYFHLLYLFEFFHEKLLCLKLVKIYESKSWIRILDVLLSLFQKLHLKHLCVCVFIQRLIVNQDLFLALITWFASCQVRGKGLINKFKVLIYLSHRIQYFYIFVVF